MRSFKFAKMAASGNDFVVIDIAKVKGSFAFAQDRQRSKVKGEDLARKICDRKYGAGADGLLVLEKSKKADIRMRIFNADGSEAEMCGNGARCAAYYIASRSKVPSLSLRTGKGQGLKLETKAGVITAQVKGDRVKIKLTEPKGIKLNIPLRINTRLTKVNFINTGVPHAAIFVEGLDKIDVAAIGRQVRYHKQFLPAGTNVDFVEALGNGSIKVRTYERGVEDETLACGTGAAASALLSTIHYPLSTIHQINVLTKSGEVLKVYFERAGSSFKNVWLEGRARIVYRGEYYV